MRINYLKTNNYRQLNDISINFKQGKNDLHLIKGKNGIGKTNFLNAINWCLYGEEPHLSKNRNQGLPLLNTKKLSELNDGDQVEVNVELQIESDGRVFTFYRDSAFRINTNTEFKCSEISSNFRATGIDNGNTKMYEKEEATEWVKKIVPFKIKDFFFFDGEQLDKYFYDKTSINLKGAITEVSQISLLQVIGERLENCAKEYSSELSRNNPDMEKAEKEKNIAEENFKYAQESLDKVKEEISRAEIRKSELDDFLKGEPDPALDEEKRDALKEKEKNIAERKDELIQEEENFLRKYMLLLNFYKPLKHTKNLIDERDKNGTLPPKINKTLLEEAIKKRCCSVCNQNLENEAVKHINKLLSEIETSDNTSVTLLKHSITVNNYIEEVKNFKLKLDNIHKRFVQIDKEIEEVNVELAEITTRISSLGNAEKIKKSYKEREDIELLYKQKLTTKGSLECNLKLCEERVQEANKKFEKTLEANSNKNRSTQYFKFADKAKVFINDVQKKVMDEYREKIRKETEDKFMSLVWKNNSFKSVTLDDTFTIGLKNSDDMECLSTCSAAERALLALSFTLALHTISGFGKALVIDTPLSRISDENRKNFTEVLLNASKTEQIILLLTPDEYSMDVDKVIGDNFATRNEYHTRFEKESYFEEG